MATEVELRREIYEVKELIDFYKAQYQTEMTLIAELQAPPEEKPAEPVTETPPAKSLSSDRKSVV